MGDAFDTNRCNRGAFDRAQQHAAKAVSNRCTKASLKRLRREHAVTVR
jgi:hypothetical protein